MRTILVKIAATVLVGLGLAVPAGGSAQAAGTYAGCPAGAVCVYPNASWNNGHPAQVYWSYGAHNLSNQYGVHRVFNNQVGGAHAWLCKSYNAVNCTPYPKGYPIEAYTYSDYDLTAINSILLTRS